MFKFIKLLIPALILTASFAVTTSSSFAKPEYSKKEKKGCTYCHVTQGKKEVNDMANAMANTNILSKPARR